MTPVIPDPRSRAAAAPPAPLDVLLVEDSSAHALLIREQLRDGARDTIRIAHVTTVDAARRHLREHGADCVLLDLTLPDARGLEAIETMRGAAADIPIVVVSVLDDEATAVQAVHEGAQDYLVKGQASGVVMARAIRYAVERKEAEVKLARLALQDPLTGLPNRTMFIDRVEQAFARQARSGRPMAVLFLDLDRFKLVNDSLGHAAGDQLLVQVAQRLNSAVRPSDTIARFGGDEFTILCEGLTSPAAVMAVADRVRAAFVEPIAVAGDELFVTPSIGIATADGPADGPHGLLRNADAAMYRAKARGGGCELYDARMRASTSRRLRLENDLRRALQRDELVLHYQPQVSGDRVCGVEALVRWRRSTGELMAPDDFIPLAEETGIIAPLGSWVLREACRQLVEWREAGLCDEGLNMAVNVSPRQLGTPDLLAALRDVLREFPIDPARLCLEVTESAVVGDSAATAQELETLKELGIQLAVDDFGTGFASLDHLNRFPLDVLKIDRRFIRGMSHDSHSKALVTAVVRVAEALELSPVAEGVELSSQAAQLRALGCPVMQGFLFSRPRPEDEVGPLLGLDPWSAVRPMKAIDAAGPAAPVRVFLCDDHDGLRELTRLQLEQHPDIVVVGEAADGRALVERVGAARPDVIMLDLSMPRMDGLEAIAALRQESPAARIVIFSGFEARSLRARALDLGAHDYIEKRAPAAKIVASVRAAGRAYREELVRAAGEAA